MSGWALVGAVVGMGVAGLLVYILGLYHGSRELDRVLRELHRAEVRAQLLHAQVVILEAGMLPSSSTMWNDFEGR